MPPELELAGAALAALFGLSEAERLGLYSLAGLVLTTFLTAIAAPLVVAAVSRRRNGAGPPASPAAQASDALDEIARQWAAGQARLDAFEERETRWKVAVAWLVARLRALEDAQGLPQAPHPPILDELLDEIEGRHHD